MDRYGETKSLGDLMKDLLPSALGANAAKGFEAMQVIDAWRMVLGQTMMKYSVREHFNDGKLFVTVTSPALRQELFMSRASVIEKINAELGSALVKEVIFC